MWRKIKEWILGYKTVMGIDGDHYVIAQHITRGRHKGIMRIVETGRLEE